VKDAAPAPKQEPPPATSAEPPRRRQFLGRVLKPDRAYLTLSVLFGLAFLLLTPPFHAPDEESHFYRSLKLSEGSPVARKEGNHTGGEVPTAAREVVARFSTLAAGAEQKTTPAETLDAFAVRNESGARDFVAFSNAAVHPPLAYLPQAAGVGLARLFSPRVLAWLYAGRLFNLLAATAVTFLAIRITPVGKWSFAALALTPMTLFQSASLSADALTNALSFLLVAQVLACALAPDGSVGKRAWWRLAATGAAVGLTKQAYFLLTLAYVLIPVRATGGRRRWWAGFLLFAGATFLAVAGWALVVRNTYSPPDLSQGMDPAGQVRLMCSSPGGFLLVLGRTAANWQLFAEEYVGYLGLLDTRLPPWLHVLEFALLLVVFLGDYDPRSALSVRQAWLAAAVALAVGLAVLAIIHVTWDKLGALSIAAQGRYFIPIGPLVAVAIGRLGGLLPAAVRRALAVTPAVAAVLIPVVLLTSLGRLRDRYYVDNPRDAAQRVYVQALKLQKSGGDAGRVRELYEDALANNPGHVKAHLQLGQLLTESHPAEAEGHFRAVLQRDSRDVVALNNLANLKSRQLEFSEAAQLYRQALEVVPKDDNVRGNLARVQHAQGELKNALRRVSVTFRALLTGDAFEKRHAGTPGEGLYPKPSRGRVVDAAGRSPLPDPYFWRIPPPGGEAVPVLGPGGQPPAGRRLPFYACCGVAVGLKRAFVFPPAEVVLLSDDEVSWYFQVPLATLTPGERQREEDYRRREGIRFPLKSLPE
jgi:uncharacterized membrane protein